MIVSHYLTQLFSHHSKYRKEGLERNTKCNMHETYVVGSDGPSRIARDKLDLHVNLCVEILILGLEARATDLVERESKKVSVVKYLRITLSPCKVKVIVESTSKDSHQKAKQQRDLQPQRCIWRTKSHILMFYVVEK